SRRRHTRFSRDWSSDVCSSDLGQQWALTPFSEGANLRRRCVMKLTIVLSLLALTTAAGAAAVRPDVGETKAVEPVEELDLNELEIGRASCRERVKIAVGARGSG